MDIRGNRGQIFVYIVTNQDAGETNAVNEIDQDWDLTDSDSDWPIIVQAITVGTSEAEDELWSSPAKTPRKISRKSIWMVLAL